MSTPADSVEASEPVDNLDRSARAFDEYVATHNDLVPGQYISIVDDDESLLRVFSTLEEAEEVHGSHKLRFCRPCYGRAPNFEYIEEIVEVPREEAHIDCGHPAFGRLIE